MTRRRVWLMVAIAGALWACDAWTVWDEVFRRAAVGNAARGWTGGDGAISTPLPGGRAFWIFGDSYVTSWTNDLRPELDDPDPWEALRHVAFGNTIGVQTNVASPSPSNITFWAKQSGTATDITRIPDAGGPTQVYEQFFDQSSLGLGSPTEKLWPAGATCVSCSNATDARLVLAFTEWKTCDPTVDTNPNTCQELCTVLNKPESPCKTGLAVKSNTLARFGNLSASNPGSWTRDGNTSRVNGDNTSIQWGVAFVQESDFLYIYGYKPFVNELYVARVMPANVLDRAQWAYWRNNAQGNGGTFTGALALRKVASEVAPYLSVDKVTRNGTTGYFLIHSRSKHLLSVRPGTGTNGSDSTITWGVHGATTPRVDLAALELAIYAQQIDEASRKPCEDLSGNVPRYDQCGLTYHGRGQAHLMINDAQGVPSLMPVSYVIPWGPNPLYQPGVPGHDDPTGGEDTRYYRPKFTALDLSKLSPFCTTDCWAGIVRDYATRTLGATSFTYKFDVTQVTGTRKFYALLTRAAGNATMQVKWYDNAAVLKRTDTCTVSAPSVTCYTANPGTATWVKVIVSGVATDQYALRIHGAALF